ncbi:hypothetical protein CXQ81_30370 [Pseudomonas sp. 09C 129]|uniref:hypothetical protein n=1 Tax=unclassified Pseudomonas TaxID=196821 RepID=UPI0002727273|nr:MULTISPECIES: hypothetical protein [unclassified Pseudomonas]AUG04726.1 hypothetical protein CXQ81_30370 [Pseudomonas sp. 09C 129]WIE50146.1 hypothetical protein PMI20_000620 [Pseudomonas sp. GM17]
MSEASKAKTKAKPVAAQGKEAYVELLNEMRVHAKRRLSGEARGLLMASPHLQQIHLRSLYVTKSSNDPAVRNLEPQAREVGESQADQSESELVKATESFQNSGSTDTTDYKKKLEELRKRDKESADKRIDKMYDAAIEQLDQYPQSADAVVGFMETFGGLFNTVLDKVSEFFTEIGKNILNWLKNVWEKITNTFNSIVSWVTGWFS